MGRNILPRIGKMGWPVLRVQICHGRVVYNGWVSVDVGSVFVDRRVG